MRNETAARAAAALREAARLWLIDSRMKRRVLGYATYLTGRPEPLLQMAGDLCHEALQQGTPEDVVFAKLDEAAELAGLAA